MRAPLLFAVSLMIAAPAAAADVGLSRLGFGPDLPACDDPAVIEEIVERQHWTEANTWHDGVRIQEIASIREFVPRSRFPSAIPARNCEARAYLGPRISDRLYYVISQEMGFASISWGVEFCMPSFDYYRAYDADCRVLR